MKTRILISLIAGLICGSASAQTADDWVSQGRSYLSAHDIADANASFAQALSLDPGHETANAFYAITRLLVLPNQPAGSNFLTHIGYPVTGRDIYDWTSIAPRDAKRIPYAPSGVNANEFPAQLRTNVLYSISGAIGNLSVITDTSFSVSLTSSETASTDVTVDYGDLEMIQAGLYASEYFIYTLNTQNIAAQLTDIRALYDGGILTASQVLSDYPQMFTFSSTNDLQAARAAFTNAVNCYMMASAFIRARPDGEIRLFNYDKVTATNESKFRSTLTDLENSLSSPQVLSINTNVTVNFAKSFNGTTTGRSLLPKFSGNAMELGSLPDLTFGGVMGGLTRGQVENYLSTYLTMLPVFSMPSRSANGASLAFNSLSGHDYLLEASTNLVNWQLVTNFTSTNSVSTWVDSQGLPKRFYRLQDDTKYIAFSGVVLDQSTGLPIPGAQVQSSYDGITVHADSNGQFILVTTVRSPGYDDLEISASGYAGFNNFYYANGLVSGLQIFLSPPPPNDNFANRTILTGQNVSVSGNNSAASVESGEPFDRYVYVPGFEPSYGNKSVWFSWTAPTTGSYVISDSSNDFFEPILAIYTGSQLANLSTVTDIFGSYFSESYHLSAVAGTTYQIEVDDYYGQGGAYTLTIAP